MAQYGPNRLPPKPVEGAKKTDQFEADFLIVAEFSEIEGPVVQRVIPNKDAAGTFPIDRFALKIMSVDANPEDPIPSKDWSAVMAVPQKNFTAYTYTHHINLYDVQARGYVRPVAFAFVTRSETKLMDTYLAMNKSFLWVSDVIKKANLDHFAKDIVKALLDLQYSLEHFGELDQSDDEGTLSTHSPFCGSPSQNPTQLPVVTVEQLNEKARDYIELYKLVLYYLHHHKRLSRRPKSVRTIAEELQEIKYTVFQMFPELNHYKPRPIHSLQKRSIYERTLRSVVQLMGDNTWELAMSQLEQLTAHFSKHIDHLRALTLDRIQLIPRSSLMVMGDVGVINFNTRVEHHSAFLNFAANPRYFLDNKHPSSLCDSLFTQDGLSAASTDAEETLYGKSKAACLMALLAQYPPSFTKHILYTVLKGRVLVVKGAMHDSEPNQQVIDAVRGLSLLVSGNSVCVPWIKYKPTVLEIAKYKIIGYPSDTEPSSSVRIQSLCSILNLDNGTLFAPEYGGSGPLALCCVLAQKRKGLWQSDETFLAFIHTTLFAFSMVVYLFYHAVLIEQNYEDDVDSESSDGTMSDRSDASDTGHYSDSATSHLQQTLLAQPFRSPQPTTKFSHMPSSSLPRRIRFTRVKSESSLPVHGLSKNLYNGTSTLQANGTAEQHKVVAFFKENNISLADYEILWHLVSQVMEEQKKDCVHQGKQAFPLVIKADYSVCHLFKSS